MSNEKLWDESPTSRHLQVLYHQTSFRDVCHSLTEKASRYVQGPARNELKKLLKHKNPRLHHLEILQNMDQDARESGCRDSCPSKGVLKQIRYESRKIATPLGNVWLALQSKKIKIRCQLPVLRFSQSVWIHQQKFFIVNRPSAYCTTCGRMTLFT